MVGVVLPMVRARMQTITETKACWNYEEPTAMRCECQGHTPSVHQGSIVGEEANGGKTVSVLSF